MSIVCKDYWFTSDMFGLKLAATDYVRLSFLCSKGHFLVNVVMPSVITFHQAMAFIGEDYLKTVDGKADLAKWKFYFFGSKEEVNMQHTPQVVAKQLKQSGYYIIVTCDHIETDE